MCLAMNADRLEPGERCASTSNRNFEGRQGAGGRTHLVKPRDGGGRGDRRPFRRHSPAGVTRDGIEDHCAAGCRAGAGGAGLRPRGLQYRPGLRAGRQRRRQRAEARRGVTSPPRICRCAPAERRPFNRIDGSWKNSGAYRRRGAARSRKRRHRRDHPEAVPEVDQAHRLRSERVRRMALSRSRRAGRTTRSVR